jgi:hypothetical protein
MKRLRLGMQTTDIRTSNSYYDCSVCGKVISPQMLRAHFHTYRTNDYTSCGVRYRSKIAWRVCGWSHLSCSLNKIQTS